MHGAGVGMEPTAWCPAHDERSVSVDSYRDHACLSLMSTRAGRKDLVPLHVVEFSTTASYHSLPSSSPVVADEQGDSDLISELVSVFASLPRPCAVGVAVWWLSVKALWLTACRGLLWSVHWGSQPGKQH